MQQNNENGICSCLQGRALFVAIATARHLSFISFASKWVTAFNVVSHTKKTNTRGMCRSGRECVLLLATTVLVPLALVMQARSIGNCIPDLAVDSLPKNESHHHHRHDDFPSPRTLKGSWVGNTWIPPSPWKLFSVDELRELYGGYRMLWIGDSTARRTSMTLFNILNATTTTTNDVLAPQLETDINVNKWGRTQHCTRWLNQTLFTNNSHSHLYSDIAVCRPVQPKGDVTLFPVMCLQEVRSILSEEISKGGIVTPDFDLIIVSVGIWHQMKPKHCPMQNETIYEVVYDITRLMNELTTIQPRLKILWRTSGWAQKRPVSTQLIVQHVNNAIMESVDKSNSEHNNKDRISYVDWGGAIAPRSYGIDRIKGDMVAHYGVEPRLVLIQMIANQLGTMDFTSSSAA